MPKGQAIGAAKSEKVKRSAKGRNWYPGINNLKTINQQPIASESKYGSWIIYSTFERM